MKPTLSSIISKFSRYPMTGPLAAATCVALSTFTAQAADITWQGSTASYNTPTNWVGGAVPGSADNAINDNGTNNIVEINLGDPDWTVNDIRAGNSAGSGAWVQNGQTATLNGWFRLGVGAGETGLYTLNAGAINYKGGDFNVGELGTGILNINGGTITGSGNFADNLGGSANTDMVTQVAGAVNVTGGGQLFVGNAGVGIYTLSGGSIDVHNYIAFGRSGGNGTFNMTGGVLNQDGGGNLLVGTGYQAPSGGSATGVLNQSGGTINCQGQFLIPENSPSTGTYNISGTASMTVNNWLAVGRGGANGYLYMSGGTITVTAGGGNLDVGAGGPGIFTQTGGTLTNLTEGTWIGENNAATWTLSGGTDVVGQVTIAVDGSGNGTLILNGGLFQATGINSTSGGYSLLDFNGGIVQANANNLNFISGLYIAQLDAGGAIIDSHGYNIAIPQTLSDYNGGGVTKVGAGTLTLSGPNSYVGPTIVSAGTLETTTASTASGGYTVSNAAGFTVQAASLDGQLNTPGVTFGASGTTLTIDLNNFGNPTVAPLNVGSLTANGPVTINILDAAPAVGTIPLVQYSSLAGSGSFVLGMVPPGVEATLSQVGGAISLVVTSAGAPRWNGTVAGGIWDINTTSNWFDLGTQTITTYRDGEPVLFDDNASGTTVVDLTATVNPGGVTVTNNNLPYTIFGTGKINGKTGLLKEGTNSLALFNTNGYTGPTVISGGILIVSNLANGGLSSAIGASSASPTNLVLGGALSYVGAPVTANRGFDVVTTNSVIDAESNFTLSGSVAVLLSPGGSAFSKTGPAQFTLATVGTNEFANNYDPGFQVQAGTMLMDGSGGQTNHTVQEMWVGGTPNSGATLILSNTTFNVDTWLGLGRGNGTNNYTSILTLYNSTVSFGNVSLGYANGIAGNLAQQFLTLNGASTLIDNGLVNLAESSGSTGAINVNGTSMILGGNQPFYIGLGGGATGSLTIANSAQVIWKTNGNTYWFDVGNNGGVGSLLIENNGSLSTAGDFNVTDQGASTGTVVVQDNGQLSANNLFVTKVPGAVGTFTITNNAMVYSSNGITIANDAAATGTVNLEGGSLAVNLVQGLSSGTPTGTFNFNGGTLIAHQPYFGDFMYNLAAANVMAGGGVINTGGNAIQITQALLNGGGGGGLTVNGGGTLYLNGVNTYTGGTVVGSGTTLGGSGAIAGPVTISSGATLQGDNGSAIGTLFINNTLSLSAGSTTSLKITPSSNDEIEGLTGVTYGGALVITNTSGSPLTAGGVFKLFNSAGAGSGNFTSITILPSGAGAFNPANGTLTITSATSGPVVNPPTHSRGNLILTGTGGAAGEGYTVLSSTNLATPLADWMTNITGVFSGTGAFSNAIPITNIPAMFFQVRVP